MSTPVTVHLTLRSMDAMQSLGEMVDGTPGSLINNAILIYQRLENLRRMGMRVYAVDEDGTPYQMTWTDQPESRQR